MDSFRAVLATTGKSRALTGPYTASTMRFKCTRRTQEVNIVNCAENVSLETLWVLVHLIHFYSCDTL